MIPRPNPKLVEALLPAYAPCPNFGSCPEAVWDPRCGHIPRGFLGATGTLAEVEVVMLFAEPGHAHGGEGYDPALGAEGLLMAGVGHSFRSFRDGCDLFHRNARWFLSQLWPDLPFEAQLRRVWMTEGRLCSIADETGRRSDRLCADHYLARQLSLLPGATVVAFGGKAAQALRGRDGWLRAYALAPPGANHRPARPSWEAAIRAVRAKRGR